MKKIFLFIFLFSCKEPIELQPTESIENSWIAPQEDIQIIERFIDSTDICLQFNSYTGYVEVQSEERDEYLSYTLENDVYQVEYIGGVSFKYEKEEWRATFDSPLIIKQIKKDSVAFDSCYPWR